jgi:broad specificity phosphatase PhoE
MSENLLTVYLARRGETASSLTGQPFTELSLTERGQPTPRQLGEHLKGLSFAKVLTSVRARLSGLVIQLSNDIHHLAA